jgi:hypothetical protein
MAVREKKKRQPDVALSHDEVPTLDVDGGDEKERVFRVGEAKLRHTLFAVEAMDGLVGPGVGVEQVGPDIERILPRYSTGLSASTSPHSRE